MTHKINASSLLLICLQIILARMIPGASSFGIGNPPPLHGYCHNHKRPQPSSSSSLLLPVRVLFLGGPHDHDGDNDHTVGPEITKRQSQEPYKLTVERIQEPTRRTPKAFDLQTPHSGRHFYPSHPFYNTQRKRLASALFLQRRRRRRKRFMEGWYYRLTLVEGNESVSFAFIISIEDPGKTSKKKPAPLACIQVVGPHDEYLVQAELDDTKFWAWKYQQGLGCVFDYTNDNPMDTPSARTMTTARTRVQFYEDVQSGFQILPQHLMGRIQGHDGSRGGVLPGQGIPGDCSFDFWITPVAGWGNALLPQTNSTRRKIIPRQRSTGGWLSSFAVFEPHWQVTLADARATGSVTWKNTTYTFDNQPFYAEKNWGKALPSKWYWTQCNSFEGYMDPGNELSVTAGGGIRQVPFGQEESLGMISVHYQGVFYEAVPWTGTMGWKVDPWGSWILYGKCTEGDPKFEVELEYKVDPETTPGLVFRAPTPKEGMVYFCKDTFEANVTLTLWQLEFDDDKKEWVRKAGAPPLIDGAKSCQGGAEIGGGPWWDTWQNDSQMKRSFKFLLQLPYKVRQFFRR